MNEKIENNKLTGIIYDHPAYPVACDLIYPVSFQGSWILNKMRMIAKRQ
jgi:hypothetical protein